MSPRFNPALARPLGIAAVALVGASSLNLQAAVAEEAAPETPTLATAEKNTERTALENDKLLADAVKKAEAAGVKVTQGKTETVDASITTLEAAVKDANADYEQQARDLEAAIKLQESYDAEYKQDVAARDSIIEQNKSIVANNDQLKAIVDAAQKAHDDAVAKNKEIAELRAQIQKSNDAGLKAKVAADEEWESTVASIVASNNKVIETNNKSLEANAKKLADTQKAVDAATPGTDAYNKAVEAYNAVAQDIKQDNQRIADENKAAIEKYNADMAKAQAERQKALDAAAAVEVENDALAKAYAEAMDVFQSKLADYEAKMAEYKRVLEEQQNSDPFVGLVVDEIAIPQPFDIKMDARNTLVETSVGMDYNPNKGQGDDWLWYNSDEIVSVSNAKDVGEVTAKWNGVAVDKESGRELNAEIKFSNITETNGDPDSAAGSSIEIYSNFIDNAFTRGIAAMKQTVTFTYADTGESYDKPYYVSFGSLNAQEYKRAEFSAPAEGVIATYIGKDSEVSQTAQPLYSSGNLPIDRGFRLAQADTRTVGDASPEVLSKLGVTYLSNNGASYWVGVSGTTPGAEPEGSEGVAATPNHIMFSANTVVPTVVSPVRPTPPNPDEYTPKVVPTVPEVNIPPADTQEIADVQVLAFTPLAPEPFIPQEEPEDVPVPPVPDYNPVPELTVPEEPVKKQAEAQYKLIDVRLQEADLKVAKTILDNDASDGSISFRIDGGNAGAITAADVLTTDLKGEGIVSIELSEALYNGQKVDDNKLRLDGDKAVLKNVAPGDTYSFVVTAEVDPNADVVTNGVKTTSPDDPDAGNPEDPQRNDGLEDDTDGWDEETTPVRNTSEQKLNKKFISFDEETGKATYEIEVENSRALAKNVVLSDIGGEGLSNPVITKAEVIQGDTTHVVDVANGTESASDATEALVDEATAEPTAEATESAQAQDFTHTVSLLPGATTSVSIFGSADEAKGAKVELGTPTGAISASWKGADVIDITAKENASGTITLPYTITKDGVTVEETIGITVETPTGDTAPVVAPATEVSAEVSAEPTADASAEVPVAEEVFVAPAASEQDALAATDPTVLDDIRVEGATATVDAMAVGERLVVTVEADVADTARLIDNAAFVTSDNGTDGKDGSQTNEDVPSDTDGWDKETNELDRPADLRVNKEVVDGDASDHKVSFRITGANIGVGDSPETVIADMTEHRVGLENPVITEVKLGEGELAAERYTVAESGDAITVDDLKAGEEVSYLIEFDVIAGATEITNAASVTSPKSPVDPNGEIQENEGIPDDEDQKDKVTVDPVAPDLKVLKEVVDGDASDGKLSFKVSGANLGTANAPETRITDELAQGLKNPVISEVSEGATIIEEEGVTGILVDDLTVGAEASFVVEFDVEPGVTEVYNAAYIDSPYAPVNTEGDIQDNNDLPGDEDQRDGVSLTADPNLKVDKEVVDGDMSDGKVSFRISGGNFGGTVEGNVLLKDAEREGLVNGTISEVVAPEGVETSVNGETLTLSELKPGETASYLITFEVLPDAAAYTNIATIESDTLKPGDGDVQENEGLDADEDQKDRVSLEKPAEPETPADPTDPAEPGTPAEGEPGTPADGGTTDSGDTVVKGETARTGDEATINPTAKGIGLGVVGGLLVGLVAWFNRTRIAQLFKREG